MTGQLPKSLTVGGRPWPIRSDFRTALGIFEAFDDPALTDSQKAWVALRCIYRDLPREYLQEAVEKAFWFLEGGDMHHSEPSPVRLLDWHHDEGMIFPAVNRVAGREVRELPYLHWWTFLGYFSEAGDCLLTTVLSIRSKRARGKALDKAEQEFLRRNKELVILRTAQEQADIDETEEFLKTIT